MTWLDEKWGQRAFEALRETLNVDTRLKRDMIQFLFDEGFWDTERLDWDSAVARFNACLNPAKDAYFKLGEVWALMKRFNRHQFALAMMEDLGYQVRALPTEERRQDLLERIAIATEQCAAIIAPARAELDRIEQPVDPHGPRPNRPKFSLAGHSAP